MLIEKKQNKINFEKRCCFGDTIIKTIRGIELFMRMVLFSEYKNKQEGGLLNTICINVMFFSRTVYAISKDIE